MIINDREFYSSPYYFFLKEYNDKYALYFSVENTLSEARKKDSVLYFEKNKEKKVKNYLKNLLKNVEKKSTDEVKNELEELVNADGAIPNSKVPILDPRLHPKRTTDQTIATARITNDPITRGYRTYFGESEVEEEDMSKAFGYEETKDLSSKQTIKKLDKMGVEDPVARAAEFGKKVKLDKKKKPGSDQRIIVKELQKKKALKVLEDLLLKDKEKNSELKEKSNAELKILMKNIKSLKKQAEKKGVEITDLIKMLKSE